MRADIVLTQLLASQSLLHPTKQQREGQGTGVTEDLDQDKEALIVRGKSRWH